jgi:WD40 repeat protein
MFDAVTGEVKLRDGSLDIHAEKLAISYNSKYLISEHANGILKVWDLSAGKPLYELSGQILSGNPFSPNNEYFAIALDESTVQVHKLSEGEEVHSFHGNQGMKTIQFANNSIHLAAGHEQAMHLWSMTSGQELKMAKQFSGTGCTIYSDFNEGPLLYITKYNRIVSIDSPLCSFQIPDWMKTFHIDEFAGRVAYGGSSKLAITMGGQSLEMNGVNRQDIIRVTINPSGNLLAAAFNDNTIHVWDVTTQQEVMSLYGHGNTITDLRFTPDGKLLLSASRDGTIRLWGIPN